MHEPTPAWALLAVLVALLAGRSIIEYGDDRSRGCDRRRRPRPHRGRHQPPLAAVAVEKNTAAKGPTEVRDNRTRNERDGSSFIGESVNRQGLQPSRRRLLRHAVVPRLVRFPGNTAPSNRHRRPAAPQHSPRRKHLRRKRRLLLQHPRHSHLGHPRHQSQCRGHHPHRRRLRHRDDAGDRLARLRQHDVEQQRRKESGLVGTARSVLPTTSGTSRGWKTAPTSDDRRRHPVEIRRRILQAARRQRRHRAHVLEERTAHREYEPEGRAFLAAALDRMIQARAARSRRSASPNS